MMIVTIGSKIITPGRITGNFIISYQLFVLLFSLCIRTNRLR